MILAFWKLYELIFDVASKRKSDAEKSLVLLNMFFAEFTYKTMKDLDRYEQAPQEIYAWLDMNFREWARSYKQRELEKSDG